MATFKTSPKRTPNKEIRAVYDASTITVYQAYNSTIANAAVENQRLDASSLFKPSRMTWIKPSWNWMMYRAGYSYKDANQSNILAIKVRRDWFENMLLDSLESGDVRKRSASQTRVQWDPERNVRIGVQVTDRTVRSIQIGMPQAVKISWMKDGIVEIRDVTDKARELKRVLDTNSDIEVEQLKRLGLVPDEQIYPISEELARALNIHDA